MRKSLLPISCDSREAVQNSTRWSRRMGNNHSSMPGILNFSICSPNPKSWQLFPKEQSYSHWTSLGSSNCENSWRIWNRSCDSINWWSCEHILRCDIQQRNRAFFFLWMKFRITKKSSGPVTNCSQTFRDQKEVNVMVKKKKIQLQQGNLCGPWSVPQHKKKTIPTNERKWKVIQTEETWQMQSPKMVTNMVRRYDQDERRPDGSMHLGHN